MKLLFLIPSLLLVMFGIDVHAENLAKAYPAPYHRAPDCVKSKVPGCITYGGLPKKPGYERDHFYDLCLLGPDVATRDPTRPPSKTNPGNVWYQPYPQAHYKDGDEDRLCREYRHGHILKEKAWKELRDKWGMVIDKTTIPQV